MKIIKHGKCMRFDCENCGCAWVAVAKECKEIIQGEAGRIYIYYCPECGHGATGVKIMADDIIEGRSANG